MEHVEVDGLRVAYRRAGSGSALLLVHGGLGDSRDWRRQLEGLGDELPAPPGGAAVAGAGVGLCRLGRVAAAGGGIPGSRLVIPGAGHVTSMEVPGRFNAEVRGFLRSLP